MVEPRTVGAEPLSIRYHLPLGERFTIDARTRERVWAGTEDLIDLEASFALACEVVGVRGDVVDILGRFERPSIEGRVPGGLLPDVERLAGHEIRVLKGLDGVVHEAHGAAPVDEIFGGLTAENALRWFGAAFPHEPVSPGDEWSGRDRWELRTERTPLRVALPIVPVVDVDYRYRLDRAGWAERPNGADVAVDIGFSGGGHSSALGLELEASGSGSGRVLVDGDSGKLEASTREAAFILTPRPLRRGALALPALRAERESRAGYRAH